MNGYIAIYKGNKIEIWSDSMYHAECQAAVAFKVKPKNQHLISVFLCERADGTEVEQSTCF
jgi:DNA-binding transcriptional regulator/RsmH inhibitor MraZ